MSGKGDREEAPMADVDAAAASSMQMDDSAVVVKQHSGKKRKPVKEQTEEEKKAYESKRKADKAASAKKRRAEIKADKARAEADTVSEGESPPPRSAKRQKTEAAAASSSSSAKKAKKKKADSESDDESGPKREKIESMLQKKISITAAMEVFSDTLLEAELKAGDAAPLLYAAQHRLCKQVKTHLAEVKKVNQLNAKTKTRRTKITAKYHKRAAYQTFMDTRKTLLHLNADKHEQKDENELAEQQAEVKKLTKKLKKKDADKTDRKAWKASKKLIVEQVIPALESAIAERDDKIVAAREKLAKLKPAYDDMMVEKKKELSQKLFHWQPHFPKDSAADEIDDDYEDWAFVEYPGSTGHMVFRNLDPNMSLLYGEDWRKTKAGWAAAADPNLADAANIEEEQEDAELTDDAEYPTQALAEAAEDLRTRSQKRAAAAAAAATPPRPSSSAQKGMTESELAKHGITLPPLAAAGGGAAAIAAPKPVHAVPMDMLLEANAPVKPPSAKGPSPKESTPKPSPKPSPTF